MTGDQASTGSAHLRVVPRRGGPVGPTGPGYGPRVTADHGATDATLVASLARTRQDALAEAYRRHAGAVLGLARRVLRAPPLAEEVLQEVFLHLWRYPERFDPGRGTLRAYLLTLAHARSVDLIRTERARRAREERDAVRRTPQEEPLDERVVEELSVGGEVEVAMKTLSEDERQAIELAYFSGQTYREVARTLGEPEGTIKSRIRTGLRRMRGALAESRIGES